MTEEEEGVIEEEEEEEEIMNIDQDQEPLYIKMKVSLIFLLKFYK